MSHSNKIRFTLFLTIFSLTFISFLFVEDNQYEYPKDYLIEEEQIEDLKTSYQIYFQNNGTPICTFNNNQEALEIVKDTNGGVIIAWKDSRYDAGDIYAQKINADGTILWDNNGTVICNATNTQQNLKIVSDGEGGAILTWEDYRSGSNWDVYTQKINATGNVEWTLNGSLICTRSDSQWSPILASDGEGGAIISWYDYRNGNADIFAQHINSTGDIQWTTDGVEVCTASGHQYKPKIVTDENNGAIITWYDFRNSPQPDIYAQRINSTGNIQWTTDGVAICTATNTQQYPEIISDGYGGAIIAWEDVRNGLTDIYAQRISSVGVVQWTSDGVAISTGSYIQQYCKLVSDGSGGAIITWWETYTGISDIYAQKVNADGSTAWTTNGIAVCSDSNDQTGPEITTDGLGGAIITWHDFRNDPNSDIYAQRISSTGSSMWSANGLPISTENNRQNRVRIIDDGFGSAFIAWCDLRNDAHYDIYAQKIGNEAPYSNTPTDITTTEIGTETIDWYLVDFVGPGQFRVLVNDTTGKIYVWRDWIVWISGNELYIPINRSAIGVFNYTIEYFDNQNLHGIPDTVIVTIKASPQSNSPGSVITMFAGSENITWILIDKVGGGFFRVLANDTNGNYYIWQNWTSWTSNLPLQIPINRTHLGIFNYTIGYNNTIGNFGISNTAIVVVSSIPQSNTPADIMTNTGGSETIGWVLTDYFGGGLYRVIVKDEDGVSYVWEDWTFWNNNSNLYVKINRDSSGTFDYTIQFRNKYGVFGQQDTVVVTIKGEKNDDADKTTPLEPISTELLIIIGIAGAIGVSAIFVVIIIKKRSPGIDKYYSRYGSEKVDSFKTKTKKSASTVKEDKKLKKIMADLETSKEKSGGDKGSEIKFDDT